MSSIPKIVRDRLKAAPPAVNHPDADVLTAFAEQSLPDRDRATVIEHLARCGDCRDVVALALPATELTSTTATQVRESRWLTWPALRWAFVAAGVVAIASIGVMRFQRHSEMADLRMSSRQQVTATDAKNESPVPPSAASSTNADKPATQPASSEFGSSPEQNAIVILPKSAPRPDTSGIHRPQARGGVTGGAAGAIIAGPAMPSQQQGAGQQIARSTTAPKQHTDSNLALQVPSVSETVAVSSPADQVAAEAKNHKADLRDESAVAPADFDAYPGGVGKAKPAASAGAARTVPSPAAPMPAPAAAQFAMAKALPPRWTISPAGSLQRSFDQGNSWQDVNVLASAAVFENFMRYSGSDTATAEKVARSKEKDANKKSLKAEAALTFRAVAANGADVWAGGQQGILYHSADAGDHWRRIVPASGSIFLTGDILAVEFADAQNGRVTTSTAESWATSDGGQTWQKQ
jgi:hypothetical protein